MIEIVDYDLKYKDDFKRLNLQWLDQYNLTESHDLEVLDDPQGTIVDRGGHIYLALSENEMVGSAALMNEGHGIYELAKMAVAEKFRGQGISKLLIEKCIAKAKEIGAKKLLLFSNHQLVTAIHLYERYGFTHVEVKDSPFLTADVKMELDLAKVPQ